MPYALRILTAPIMCPLLALAAVVSRRVTGNDNPQGPWQAMRAWLTP